jgi:hypothetical protein
MQQSLHNCVLDLVALLQDIQYEDEPFNLPLDITRFELENLSSPEEKLEILKRVVLLTTTEHAIPSNLLSFIRV